MAPGPPASCKEFDREWFDAGDGNNPQQNAFPDCLPSDGRMAARTGVDRGEFSLCDTFGWDAADEPGHAPGTAASGRTTRTCARRPASTGIASSTASPCIWPNTSQALPGTSTIHNPARINAGASWSPNVLQKGSRETKPQNRRPGSTSYGPETSLGIHFVGKRALISVACEGRDILLK